MGRVVVVDDNPDLCTVLAKLLRAVGHEATALTEGEAVVPFLREQPAALVILDVMMPGMDGFDVLAAIRGDPRTAAVPVVMFTALSDPAVRRRALDQGAQDYMVKSRLTFDAVRDVVGRYVPPSDGRQTASPVTRP